MNLKKLFGDAANKMDAFLQFAIMRLPEDTDPNKHLFNVLIRASKIPFADIEGIHEIAPGVIYTGHQLSLNQLKQLVEDESVIHIEKSQTLRPA